VSADPEASRDGIRAASAGSARHGIGRLQLAAWRHALAHATSIAAVVDVVQRIVSTARVVMRFRRIRIQLRRKQRLFQSLLRPIQF